MDPMTIHSKFAEADSIASQQKLGVISNAEKKEANKVVGRPSGVYFLFDK